jgi:hypothetical protein
MKVKRALQACTVIVLIIICPLSGSGQSQFDSVYYHIAVNLAGSDAGRATAMADSLLLQAKDDLQKVKVQMLLATLQAQVGERDQAVQNARKAEAMAARNKWYDWQARSCGILSTHFRNKGLINEGKKYL